METPRAERVSLESLESSIGPVSVVEGCRPAPRLLRAVVIGPERTRDLAVRALTGLPFRLETLAAVGELEFWLSTYHIDVVLLDELALGSDPEPRLLQVRSSVFQAIPLLCVIGEAEWCRNRRCLPRCTAHLFPYPDSGALRSFLECTASASAAAGSAFTIGGSLPKGGIRFILSILEAAQYSGRLVVQPRDSPQEQIVLWIRQGEPAAAYSGGVQHAEPLGQITEVTEGWFSFVESEVGRDALRLVETWHRRARHLTQETADSGPEPVAGVRSQLKMALSAARNIGEMREAVQSLLDAGIDKAAEEGDTRLMDSLADVSILLQKNRIEDAFKLLRTLLG